MKKTFTQHKSRIKKTIWIADTSPVVRTGLRDIISSIRTQVVVKEVAAFDQFAPKHKDCLSDRQHFYIGDTQLSANTGMIDIVRELTAVDPHTQFLFLTNVDARIFEPLAFEPVAMASADCTFISKNDRDIIQKVEAWLLSRVKQPSTAAQPAASSSGHRLSERESCILKHLLSGQSRKCIAEHLQIKYPTVATYVDRICRKLGVRDLNHAVKVADELGGADRMAVYS